MVKKKFLGQAWSVNPLTTALIAFIYFLAGYAGLWLAVPGTNVTPIWLPSGVALAAVILYGYPILFGVFLGSFLLNTYYLWQLLPFWGTLHILIASAVTGIGASLQAAFGAFLIQHFIKGPWDHYQKRAGSVIKFLIIALISCLINSTIGTLALTIEGFLPWELFPLVWRYWWIGDCTGVIVITPLIISWVRYPIKDWSIERALEAIIILGGILLTALLNRTIHLPNPVPVYLYFPWLIWAAIRFQLLGASFTLSYTIIILYLNTISGYGGFVQSDINNSLLWLDLFIIITAPTVLSVGAAFTPLDEN